MTACRTLTQYAKSAVGGIGPGTVGPRAGEGDKAQYRAINAIQCPVSWQTSPVSAGT
jgi:hypothetical protein